MATFVKRLSAAALAGAAAWVVLSASPAPAQQPGGQPAQGQPAQGQNPGQFMGRGAQAPGLLGGFNPGFGSPYASRLGGLSPFGVASMTSTPYGTPYGGAYPGSPGLDLSYLSQYPPYLSNGYYDWPDPFGGGLRGAAAAIDSEGRYEVMWQQSRLVAQEVERSKVDTRRKIYDEWLYERATRPTLEDERERSQAYELRRILHDPPTTDVVSGYALNTLLKDIVRKPGYASGLRIELDPKILKQVNVTSSNGGNVGILKFVKDGAPLPWPLPLQGSAYLKQTLRLNHLAAEAVNSVTNNGHVDPGTLNDMIADVRDLKGMVSANINELTPSQSVEAKRFLNQLDDAILALKQQDIANYFTDKWAAKGKTVADLVAYMANNGLTFAPAVSGDEAAYAALYNALAGYRHGLETEIVRDGSK